ncbi:MerR family transcriptional regulator [Dongia sp.]|uniref:MerR family transcriptional regulator n=1 Tax=Dongia sp. TaxID=1977262 RepID=UPI0037516B8A
MFRIGEFSRIARVSGRLLRYYDSIGLLSPGRVDSVTGYRYYTADQLAVLNRILALKDLGLSLDEVAQLLKGMVSADEIRGMLTLKKVELERSLSEGQSRLRNIESRLLQIEEQGGMQDYEVIVKSAVAQPYLALRRTFPSFMEVVQTVGAIAQRVGPRLPESAKDNLVVVAHSDFDEEALDLEIGYALKHGDVTPPNIPGFDLALRALPAAPSLATLVRRGPGHQSHIAYGALGLWMSANQYRIDGPSREVLLELPFQRPGQEEMVMEVQFPVTKAA